MMASPMCFACFLMGASLSTNPGYPPPSGGELAPDLILGRLAHFSREPGGGAECGAAWFAARDPRFRGDDGLRPSACHIAAARSTCPHVDAAPRRLSTRSLGSHAGAPAICLGAARAAG